MTLAQQSLTEAKAIITADESVWTLKAITDATDKVAKDNGAIDDQWEYYDRRAKAGREPINIAAGRRLSHALDKAYPPDGNNKAFYDFMEAVDVYDKNHTINERLSLLDKAINAPEANLEKL